MKIYDYWGKRVKITTADGQIFIGHVAYYTSELDDPNGIESISVEVDGKENVLFGFTKKDITDIEILTADVPSMANAV